MQFFHASRKRFTAFDMGYVGTGQEVNRYAFGIHLGEPEAVAEYYSTYEFLDDTDKSYVSEGGELVEEESDFTIQHNGVCYSVSLPSSVIQNIVKWDDDASIELLNDASVALYNALGLAARLPLLEDQFEALDIKYEEGDIEDLIDCVATHLYDTACENGLYQQSVDSETIKAYLFRKFRNDDYTQGELDDDFEEYLDGDVMDLFQKVSGNEMTIEDCFTQSNLYEAVTSTFEARNKTNKIDQSPGRDIDAKKSASLLLSSLGICGYIAPSMHGRSNALEVIIIDDEVARNLSIEEVSIAKVINMKDECGFNY